MIIAWMLLAVGAIATGVCFARGFRTAGVLGLLASLGLVGVLLVPGWTDRPLPGIIAGLAYATAMVTFLATRPSTAASSTAPPAPSNRLRRALVGGMIGTVPGILVIVVPLVLHEVGTISADASQIGFLGIFLVPVGLVAGTLVGALTGPQGAPDGGKVAPRA